MTADCPARNDSCQSPGYCYPKACKSLDAHVISSADWQPVETIPLRQEVEVLTAKGLRRIAKVTRTGVDRMSRWIKGPDRFGPKRVHCRCGTGDVWAVGWRALEATK